MRKDVALLKAMELTGEDAFQLIGVKKENKHWIKRSVNTVVGSNALVQAINEIKEGEVAIEEVVEPVVAPIIDITPISKPSDRFDIDDYILYQEYMIANGGVPSIEDYFKAIEYYKSRA